MKFAYADPPYVGQAKKHYDAAEVDHEQLIAMLVADFPDGWALSCSSPSLRQLLPMCPDNARVMAWVKPFAIFKPNVNPAYAWEPVIVHGGRKRGRDIDTVRDWVSENVTLRRGLTGVKPARVLGWLFDVLNVQSGDEIVDLFPGTSTLKAAAESRFALDVRITESEVHQPELIRE